MGVAGGWALLGGGSAVPASCAATGTKVYSFRGVKFDDQPFGAFVHQDISGRTCGPQGVASGASRS